MKQITLEIILEVEDDLRIDEISIEEPGDVAGCIIYPTRGDCNIIKSEVIKKE